MVFKGENALRWEVDGRAKDWWRAGRKRIFWMRWGGGEGGEREEGEGAGNDVDEGRQRGLGEAVCIG
jgi:hypothetical protein